MKSSRLALSLCLMSLSTAAFAQHQGHTTPPAEPSPAPAAAAAAAAPTTPAPAPKSPARKAYNRLKTLEGTWEGKVTTTPKQALAELQAVDAKLGDMDGKVSVAWGVGSNGHALTHVDLGEGPHYKPLTVFYVEKDRLLLTHFCAFNNRPRMEAKISDDGNTVDFQFLDVEGVMKYGYMRQATIVFIDDDHHTEDWVFNMPGDQPLRAHMDLRRVK